jgi:hypothetical protein
MAFNPPAEAPIPTIRKPGSVTGRTGDGAIVAGGSVALTSCRFVLLFLARVLEGAVLLVVFRAAATESSPRHKKNRGTEKSRLARPRLN